MDHPGKTPAQRRVLDEIGCGNYSPVAAKRTIQSLLVAGIIEPCGQKIIGHFGALPITVAEYQMTIPAHYQWCQAMSELPHD